jgi:hypothetical protein
MTDSPSINGWKKLALRAFFGGVGFAFALAIIAGAALWYHNRPECPKPWNSAALKATFDTMEISSGGTLPKDSYGVDFYYNIQNNTDRNYQINASTFTPMAVLTDGNALSKEFGHHQSGDTTVDGPAFIPPAGTARVTVRVSYFYPNEFTQADKDDIKKIIGNFNHRLQELSGFVIFDEQNHYRVDLPEGWKQMPGVKADTAVPIETH